VDGSVRISWQVEQVAKLTLGFPKEPPVRGISTHQDFT
jgi:hypothetical protein